MNVLSLFDGVSCARIALENLDIPVTNYFSSEIDKHCIRVSSKHYPDIIQLGDVCGVDTKKLPKIDLLIGGSPCQDLSNAKAGKGLKGKKSRLFYEFIRIYKELKPRHFLLENVKNKWGNEMSNYLKTPYQEINSNIFTAQSRPRYYWSNIEVPPPPNQLSKLKILDIIEPNPLEKYTITKNKTQQKIKTVKLSSKTSKDGLIKAYTFDKETIKDNERQRRIYSVKGKSPTILARSDTTKIIINDCIRKMTPLECERLQGLPDNYTSILSDTQRYKAIGNGFTIPVIEYFLKNLNKKPKLNAHYIQKKLFSNEVY